MLSIMNYLFYLLLLSYMEPSMQRSTPEDDHYIAAVVEYFGDRTVESTMVRYPQLIREAADQNADIVVFPESTMTNSSVSFKAPIHGILQQFATPAEYPELYDELLVTISTAARDNDIYVVVNGLEFMDCTQDTGEFCPEMKEYFFNTNLVFNRTGAIIQRYRKINLFGEFSKTPALQPDLGVFTTDFGVTFGQFICFDLMFQVPAVQVVQKYNVRDIIFPTMWFSELPYLTAVQIQEAYAYAMDVNFLASGANRPSAGSSGSGIYSGKAGALISTMTGISTTRLLVAKVPKVPGLVTEPVPGPIYDDPVEQDSLTLIVDPSVMSHVSRLLVEGSQEFTLVDKDVSCTFNVSMVPRQGDVKYQYRAMAFSGVRSFTGMATGGTRVCSVVACTGDTMDTCGSRFPTYTQNTTAIFEELRITGTVPTPKTVVELNADDSFFLPLSSLVNILPLEDEEFSYNVTRSNDVSIHTLILNNNTAELYTFALWGRVFETDGLEADPPLQDYLDNSSPVHVLSRIVAVTLLGVIFCQL